MRWKKMGLVFAPNGDSDWAMSHAMLPTPMLLDDKIRIYVGVCDKNTVGRIGYVDVEANNPGKVLSFSKTPLLDIGLPGSFDENGVVPTSIVTLPNGDKYLYYVGFELGTKIRYRLLSGVAISQDEGHSFQRISRAPILERTDKELYFRCAPYVLYDENKFKLWYVAGSEWTELNGSLVPVYVIKYQESNDGLTWADEGHVCIPISHPDEHGFGRPYVVKEAGLYKMFYSIRLRNKGYRLGYAESLNGYDWNRLDDKFNLDVSADGWDSQTVCYSALIHYNQKTYLFYNGNNFGGTGFGYAIQE